MRIAQLVRPLAVAAAAALLAVPLVGAPAAAAPPGPRGGAGTTYEAENGVLTGVVAARDTSGYSGTGYVTGFDEADDSDAITVCGGSGGLYDLTIRYSAPFGDKKTTLLLNGAPAGEIGLPATTGFAEVAAGQVLLGPGDNTITLDSDWGWYDVDAIRLARSPTPPPHRLSGIPVNPNATPAARSLLGYLGRHYGRDLISGQQDLASIDWLDQTIGAQPAIGGFDMMDYSPSRVERQGNVSHAVEDAETWDARGGITTFVWHWNAPSGLIDVPGEEWWRGFYTDATTFDVAAALADPTSDGYRLLLRDIDAIAVQLQRLSDAGIPVLWRPLHEAEGGWFWWGAKGPGPAKALYRLMYDRLTNVHHLNNLIWVWNSVGADWYPGDDVVDLVSDDSYPPVGDHGPVSATYHELTALVGDHKPAALAEVGSIPDPELTRAYRADWSYFVTWGGTILTDGVINPVDLLRRVYADPHVITLATVGDFKHTPYRRHP